MLHDTVVVSDRPRLWLRFGNVFESLLVFRSGARLWSRSKGRVCSVLYPPGLFFHTSCQGSEISTVCFLSNIMELDGNRLKANGANNKAVEKKMHLNDSTAGFLSRIHVPDTKNNRQEKEQHRRTFAFH